MEFKFRNIVVPMVINQSSTIDDIIESIKENLRNLESKECNLEVEGKLGYINVFNERDFSILQAMEQISTKNYVDLSLLKDFKKQFISNQTSEMFFYALRYFENVYNLAGKIDLQNLRMKNSEKSNDLYDYLENFSHPKEDMTIDYILDEKFGKKKRLTLNPFSGKTVLIEKANKRHFDLIHNSIV
jgi:hypothetical protein